MPCDNSDFLSQIFKNLFELILLNKQSITTNLKLQKNHKSVDTSNNLRKYRKQKQYNNYKTNKI